MLYFPLVLNKIVSFFTNFDKSKRNLAPYWVPGSNTKVSHSLPLWLAVVFSCVAGNSRLSLALLINFFKRLIRKYRKRKLTIALNLAMGEADF